MFMDAILVLLSPDEREDVRAGRCRLLQHEGTPILDYGGVVAPSPTLPRAKSGPKRDRAAYMREYRRRRGEAA